MSKSVLEQRMESRLSKVAAEGNFKYELLLSDSVERLGKKIVEFLIEEIIVHDHSTKDLYVTYRKKQYIVEASVVEVDGVLEFGFGAMPLLAYIYQHGNYGSVEEFMEEEEDKVKVWEDYQYYY